MRTMTRARWVRLIGAGATAIFTLLSGIWITHAQDEVLEKRFTGKLITADDAFDVEYSFRWTGNVFVGVITIEDLEWIMERGRSSSDTLLFDLRVDGTDDLPMKCWLKQSEDGCEGECSTTGSSEAERLLLTLEGDPFDTAPSPE